jgi:uncharacterized membrane protein
MVIGPLPGTVAFFPVFGAQPFAPQQLPLPMIARQQIQVWQGPYPPPEALREYEKIQPGAFNRMLTMAEQAQTAQINSIQRAQENQRRDSRRGQWLGAGISVIAMGLAVYCAMNGQSVVGGLLLSVPVMAVGKALIEGVRGPRAQPPTPVVPEPPQNVAQAETTTKPTQ